MKDPTVLDNTPTWVKDDTTGTGHGLGRCNPFGYERDASVLGGTHGIEHERYLYFCRNWATARYWLTCPDGHRGQVAVCDGHAQMIRNRMTGVCPRCAWPPEMRQLDKSMNDLMREIAGMLPLDPARARAMRRLEELRHEATELTRSGRVKTGGPLRLEEVS